MKFRLSAPLATILMAWFVMFALSACRDTPTDPPPDNHRDTCCGGALVLNVIDSASTHHVMGGTYVLKGEGVTQTVHPNDHGQVIFNHLCPGTYEVVGEAEGYNRHVEHYKLDCNDEQHHDFNMSPAHHEDDCCHGVVTLILRDSATGEAISGGTVRLWKGHDMLGEQTINPHGNSWDGLCEGDGYSFSVSKDGYNHYEWSIEALTCNERRTTDRRIGTVRHALDCDNASMTFIVMDSLHHDLPVSGASVTIRISGSSDIYSHGTTDDHGRFTANHIRGHKTYSIRVAKDGYGVKEFIWQLGDCDDYTEHVWMATR
jgi:hypothetical protein